MLNRTHKIMHPDVDAIVELNSFEMETLVRHREIVVVGSFHRDADPQRVVVTLV